MAVSWKQTKLEGETVLKECQRDITSISPTNCSVIRTMKDPPAPKHSTHMRKRQNRAKQSKRKATKACTNPSGVLRAFESCTSLAPSTVTTRSFHASAALELHVERPKCTRAFLYAKFTSVCHSRAGSRSRCGCIFSRNNFDAGRAYIMIRSHQSARCTACTKELRETMSRTEAVTRGDNSCRSN